MRSILRQPNSPLLATLACLCAGMMAPAAAFAREPASDPLAVTVPTLGGTQLGLTGYGELWGAWLDHGPNQNREGGAQRDARVLLDTARFVLGFEIRMPLAFFAEAELEIEHGGAGAAMELEYEEFGEFEAEIERGGEVVLEELVLGRAFGPVALELGRVPVAVGLLAARHLPTQRLGPARAEGEQRVLPAIWTELGVALEAEIGPVEATAQIVNGLDSSGFSSQGWVSTGHQQRFELTSASAPAGVLRLDIEHRGLLLGASTYVGGSTRNRPKPDLVPTCDSAADEVAPCGVTPGRVLIVGAHGEYIGHGVSVRASGAWGRLQNADLISERNARLSNNLDVLRTTVADEAWFVWGEIGFDVLSLTTPAKPATLSPWVGFEWYDTMGALDDGRFDNPRFERTLVSAGLHTTIAEHVTASVGWSMRVFGTSELRREQSAQLGVGFVY